MTTGDLSEHDRHGLYVSLRDFFDLQFREHEKSHVQLAKSVETALAAMDKRLESMNEFRATVSDVQSRSITREMFESQHEQVKERLNALESFRGRASLVATGIAITAGTMGAIVGFILTKVIK